MDVGKLPRKRRCATPGCAVHFVPRDDRHTHHSPACRLRAFWKTHRRDYHSPARGSRKSRIPRSPRACVGPSSDGRSKKCGKWFVPVSRHNIFCEECRKIPPPKRRTHSGRRR